MLEGELASIEALKDLRSEMKQQKEVRVTWLCIHCFYIMPHTLLHV